MPTSHFLKSREKGKIGQHFLAQTFRSWGAKVDEVPDGFFTDYDLVVHGNSGPRTVEVKHDYRAEKTGNICLELDALWHSKADLLAIVVGNPIKTIYLLPLQPALALAQSWPRKSVVGERAELAALIPIDTFISKLNPQVLITNQ